MQKTFNYIKKTLLGIVFFLVFIYSLLYVLLSISPIQQRVKDEAVTVLTEVLKTRVSVGEIQLRPFNKVAIHEVLLYDQKNDTLLFADKISAGFRFTPLLNKHLAFTTIQLMGFDVRLNREYTGEPLNIDFLAEAFASKDTLKKEFPFSVNLNSLFLRRGSFRYDNFSEQKKPEGFDKNHIRVNNLLATISLRNYSSDSLNVIIKRMSLEEQGGLILKKLGLELIANKQHALLRKFTLQMPETNIGIDSLTLDYTRVNTLKQFVDSAEFSLKMAPSQVSLQDISCFTPALKHFETPVELELAAHGQINQIEVPSLSVYADKEIVLNAHANLVGITRPSEAYIFGEVNNLDITPNGMMLLINNFSHDKKENLKILNDLGNIRFKGDISGFFTNLVAYGNIQSRLGLIRTDILLGKDFEQNRLTCKGKVSANDLRVGLLFPGKNLLNNVSFAINVDLDKTKNQDIKGKIKGNIKSFDFKGYRYEHLALDGKFRGKSFDGSVLLSDPNGEIKLNGAIDLSSTPAVFNFATDIKNLRPGKLKLFNKYPDADLSLRLGANFTGDKFDTTQGEITIDSLILNNNGEQLVLQQLTLDAFNHEIPQVTRIRSDLINAQIRGRYNFAALYKELLGTLAEALPILADNKRKKSVAANDFEFGIHISETSQLKKVLDLPFELQKAADISGFYNSDKGLMRIAGTIPRFKYGKMQFEDGNMLADMPDDVFRFRFSTIKLNNSNEPLSLSLNATASDGLINTRFDWSNTAETTYSGNLAADIRFTKREKSKYPLRTDIDILPSVIIFNDSIWNMMPSTTVIDSGKLEINDFEIRHSNQHLRLNGIASQHERDTLKLNLSDMSLDYIFQTLNMNFIMFGGQGTGEFMIANQDKVPVIKTDSFKVKDFSYNGVHLGDLNLYSDWDARHNGIRMKGAISQADAKPTLIDGGIYLAQDSLWLNFKADRLNVGFVDIWTNNILRDLQGRASGDITLFGKFRTLNLVGNAWGEQVSFGIDYLNTVYSITDSVFFHENGINFNNISVYDRNQVQAFANGSVSYHNFKDIAYDISFLIPQGRAFQVFNVTERINPVYWGNIFASGSARIYGDTGKTWIDVSARSSANSKFNFSLNENMTAGDYQFITFRDTDAEWKINQDPASHSMTQHSPLEIPEKEHELFLNLQMEATPDVSITLIMDPATGDQIKGTGNGNIRLEYNKTNDFKLYGNYTIDKGNYYFNLQDVIMRDFSINQGSRVNFRGNPMNTELNIHASYQVTANLTDLNESFAQSRELSRPNVPVQCILNIKGDLRRPDLSFDINLPTVSEDIDRQVKSIISTDDMMNRQVLYLMILNKFYTPDNINQPNRYSELTSMASSTLSSQLNNLLGQISDNWNIGTNIRSDKGDFSDVEVELALSSQLLNNRLLFNGNLGYRDNPNANNSFIGDFDLEYLITPGGSWRLKAYNHYNDRNYSVKSALTTQGVGIMFKKDFNTITDLFNLFMRRKNRIKEPDLSISTDSIPDN